MEFNYNTNGIIIYILWDFRYVTINNFQRLKVYSNNFQEMIEELYRIFSV